MLSPTQIVDRARYPIDEPSNALTRRAVSEASAALASDGCAVVRGFLSEQGLQALLGEASEREGLAYYSPNKQCNVYLGDGDPGLPPDHPRNRLMERTNGFVTADRLGPGTSSHALYHWQPLSRFLADCLGKDRLFIYEDPVSNMIVNLCRPGQQFNWHFDTNEFTITMLLQSAKRGGLFEYVPELRTPTDECFAEVGKVLDGDRARVRRLELNAGDLQLFLGRYSLHQVTRNEGARSRLLLITDQITELY